MEIPSRRNSDDDAPMPYTCEICPSLDQLDLASWNTLADDGDLFMDARFMRAVDRGQCSPGKLWWLIVRDAAQRPVAIACLSLLAIDIAMLSGRVVGKIGTSVRRLFPSALRYQAILCGLPVSAGQNHLKIAHGTDSAAVLHLIVDKMARLARAEGARFLVFKEFDDRAASQLGALGALGFYRGESPPMNHLPARFSSFAQYRAALKAPYRSKIIRSQRKAAELGLRTECLSGGDSLAARFTDDVHRMYLAVVEKSPLRLEVLSAEWFRQMARGLERESAWTAIYEGDHLLAWAYGLLLGGTYQSLFGGVDYARNAQTDAYFNLMYHELDFAVRQGVREIQLGQTADDFKGRLGAYQSRRWFFVKPLRWKAKAVLRLAAEQVLPKYPPPAQRHVFHASP